MDTIVSVPSEQLADPTLAAEGGHYRTRTLMPGTPISGGGVAFLAATPNLKRMTDGHLGSTSIAADEPDEGVFGIIHVQTSGDFGDPPLREDKRPG